LQGVGANDLLSRACAPLRPSYAAVQECFPYLARRLLADDDPRVRKALRDVLYGGKTRLDVDRWGSRSA